MTASRTRERRDEPWSPYRVGKLSLREAAHLYRRAQFGATWGETQAASQMPLTELVDHLLAGNDDSDFERQSRAMQSVIQSGNLAVQLPAWWLYRLQRSPHPALEKLVVFWHGHFATSAAKVVSGPAMLRQNATLRACAMGPFAELVLAISRDPAMLIYLDSATNRRNHPNENYARELLELFCLGLGNYDEHDIRELARAFTGWEIQRGQFVFNAFQHDPNPQSILGKSDIEGGEQAIAWIVNQPAAAEFIARKLFRFYVSDLEPERELIQPLANCLREHDFAIRPALQFIFRSQIFFSQRSIAQKIRSPIDLAVGLLRVLGLSTSPTQLASTLGELGQALFYPPSVKGWDGGKQWINSATWIGRVNMTANLLNNPQTESSKDRESLDRQFEIDSTLQAVERVEQLWLATPLEETTRESLIGIVDRTASRGGKLLTAFKAASTLAEFQLG